MLTKNCIRQTTARYWINSKAEQYIRRYLRPLSFWERQQSSFLRGRWQADCERRNERARQRRGRGAQRSTRGRSPPRTLCGRATATAPRCVPVARARAASWAAAAARNRLLCRDEHYRAIAEMLLIMLPDKPALCRVLPITRSTFHERRPLDNRYLVTGAAESPTERIYDTHHVSTIMWLMLVGMQIVLLLLKLNLYYNEEISSNKSLPRP